jgi:hypothetical protein
MAPALRRAGGSPKKLNFHKKSSKNKLLQAITYPVG